MSKFNLQKRAVKLWSRRVMGREYAKMVGQQHVLLSIVNRGFFGRLKWAFLKR